MGFNDCIIGVVLILEGIIEFNIFGMLSIVFYILDNYVLWLCWIYSIINIGVLGLWLIKL